MNPIRRYASAQNETASPERLMVLLFQAALRHMRSGVAALEGGQPAQANAALSKATDIVVQLHASFDTARDPELAKNLGLVYEFVCQRLISANLKRDAKLAREAERVFLPVADAFASAAVQAAAGASSGAAR